MYYFNKHLTSNISLQHTLWPGIRNDDAASLPISRITLGLLNGVRLYPPFKVSLVFKFHSKIVVIYFRYTFFIYNSDYGNVLIFLKFVINNIIYLS